MKIAVIGSGPAAASAAHTLVEQGHDISMIDIGYEIEKQLEELTHPGLPLETIRKKIQDGRKKISSESSELPEKLPFGSRFVYWQTEHSKVKTDPGTKILSSFALGGLSNVWGANVCGIADRDMNGWPFKSEALKSSFSELNKFITVASETDSIDQLYRFPVGTRPTYLLGPLGNLILEESKKHQNDLVKHGIHVGRAKIACGPQIHDPHQNCVSCGLCMYGCPYNVIFNSANVIRTLRSRPNFKYLGGKEVSHFVENETSVTIFIRNLNSKTNESLNFDSVFIGCGVIGSTAIVARSMKWCDHEFKIQDSQKYYFPFFTRKRIRGAMNVEQNTLAQVFLQLSQLKETSHIVHFQLYPFNEVALEAIRHSFGFLADIGIKFAQFLFDRLMVGMVYLHSQDSGYLSLKIPTDPEEGLAVVHGFGSPKSKGVAKESFKLLQKNWKKIGGYPLLLFAKKGPPGRSQHFGGTLPMRISPIIGETDILGRPCGSKRVHVVDASVLTSITGTPTTYTVMANAVRIAKEI